MDKTQERLLNSAANAKLVHLNDSVIFPKLNQRAEMELASMCEEFKRLGTVKVSSIAYITAIRDLMQELNGIARHGDKAAATLGHNKID